LTGLGIEPIRPRTNRRNGLRPVCAMPKPEQQKIRFTNQKKIACQSKTASNVKYDDIVMMSYGFVQN